MKKVLIFGILLFILGCDKKGNGTVSFGSNDDLLNCIHEATVFIDGNEIGTIPGYCESILDCASENTLNHIITEGEHSYEIVIQNESGGSCYMEKTGEFIIGEDECVKIYFNVIQSE